jgi:hypothetical protein
LIPRSQSSGCNGSQHLVHDLPVQGDAALRTQGKIEGAFQVLGWGSHVI